MSKEAMEAVKEIINLHLSREMLIVAGMANLVERGELTENEMHELNKYMISHIHVDVAKRRFANTPLGDELNRLTDCADTEKD